MVAMKLGSKGRFEPGAHSARLQARGIQEAVDEAQQADRVAVRGAQAFAAERRPVLA